ncbi:N-acetylglucosaminyldiphosphoundecaprenol N-acetyl-beta-D-mannosaminyltransferase [Planomicrobium soli]|uniref:N-acetylglucosaminyldiphosphoundecaprenol N-acetyl-beta-D-mannosaminyltransferase n=1 Tax=Planomicrobium soli TaxID=1176648 RepID=A0A2P8GCJ7_9BACL|nr:WecB/TagA/CpsF family glycosyltransferase [Planomicrobium soli]PSL31702.1 N-acetylglucosaminyldiphosphoundecaprenol N-acetyl-beta-D-mannosaminyltransferase [Planomicrobium soli]
MAHEKLNIVGIPVDNLKREQFLSLVYQELNQKQKNIFIVTANPEIIMNAKNSPSYRNALLQADYIIPDGFGVIKASNILGNPLPEKITGYDLVHTFLSYASETGKSVYFFGAKEGIAQEAINKAKELYPNFRIAGTKHGYAGLTENVAEEIASAAPDFVFVGLGAPMQEEWIASYQHLFPHSVLMGVGGSFDVLSGNVNRAPKFWLDRNLEWFHRLITQPTRGKRMLKLPVFVAEVYKQKWASRNSN